MRPVTVPLALVLISITLAPAPRAQHLPQPGFVCAHDEEPGGVPQGSAVGSIDDGPDVRALLVLVKFRDDDFAFTNRGWPLYPDPRQLPPFATSILAPDAASITQSDSSLSRFFYEQSKISPGAPGQLRVFGDIYPRNAQGQPEVYVTKHDNDYYHSVNGGGYGYLTKEILDSLVTVPGFDIADYDLNEDGVLDHLFLVIRNEELKSPDTLVTYSGCSSLDAHNCGNTPLHGRPVPILQYWSPRRQDLVTVDWSESGSHNFTNDPGNIIPLKHHVTLLAHEWGHELWGEHFVHLRPITDNDVPLNAPPVDNPADYGYTLMQGGDSAGTVSSLIISVHERLLKGWISPTILDAEAKNLLLPDLYTSAAAYSIPLVGDRTLHVANLQRNNYFYTLHKSSSHPYPYDEVLNGLPTTGMIVTLTDIRPSETGRRLDVLPSDNDLEGVTWFSFEPNPYDGDLYSPSTSAQITPWTRPNINGCTSYDHPYCNTPEKRTWKAIDNIRYLGDADSTIVFDFYEDFRTAPVVMIRADSWMGHETAGSMFQNEVRVTNGATLTIEEGVTLTFNEDLVVESGAALVTEEGAVLQFGPGAQLRVEGALAATGTTFREGDPRQGWAGIDVRPAATHSVGTDPVTPSATFVGSIIEGVERTGPKVPTPAVVSVYNATADLSGTTIQDGTSPHGGVLIGLLVAGKQAEVTVRDASKIRRNPGPGIVAQSRALVDVHDSEILRNTGSGVVAASRASVYLFQNQISRNGGYGVHATDYGIVAFSRPAAIFNQPGGYNLVAHSAAGGLLADDGGTIIAGIELWETGSCLQGCFNTIQNHSWALAPFDAKAADYGTVWATLNFWGDEVRSVDDLVLIEESGGIVVVDSVLTAPPALLRPSETPLAGAAGGDASGVAERSDSPRLLLRAAKAAAAEGDYTGAFGLLRQVIGAAEVDYQRLAYTEALRLLQEEQPPAVMSFLGGVAAGESPYRPWALRALVVGHEASAQPTQAEAAAGALIEGFGGGRHALFGHLARVHLRLGQDDLDGAEAALVEAEAGWPEHPAVAAARELLAWLTDEEGSSARGGGAGEAGALRTDGEAAARSPAAAYRLSAYPNPSAGSATVALELAAAGAVRVALFDVLGREVAVLADRVLEAGRHALPLGGRALPSGTYVVRAEVTEAGGSVRILTQKLILAR